MSIPDVIYQSLRALVSDRIWPNRFAQPDGSPVWPAIRYTLVVNDPAASLCGTDDEDTDDVIVQFDIAATTYAVMRTVKAQLINALDNTDPPCSRQPGGFETWDAETKTHRAVLDFRFQQSSAP